MPRCYAVHCIDSAAPLVNLLIAIPDINNLRVLVPEGGKHGRVGVLGFIHKNEASGYPEIPGSFILMDEAQDTNPAMLAALRNQDSQIVYVGDRYQQIYEWRGAVNAMDSVTTRHRCFLTQSFRFGNAIADAATLLLRALGEEQRLTGTTSVASKLGCGQPNAVLCRTNAGVIDHVIQAFAAGLTPCVVGGTVEALR